MLLPVFALLRRVDLAEVIGAALAAKAAGAGARSIAAALGRPAETVRGWLRRFGSRAGRVRACFIRLLVEVGVDPVPPAQAPSAFADAVAAVAGASVAAVSTLAGYRRGAAVVAGLRGQRRPAAGPGLAPRAGQHELPLTSGAGCLRVFAGSVMPRP